MENCLQCGSVCSPTPYPPASPCANFAEIMTGQFVPLLFRRLKTNTTYNWLCLVHYVHKTGEKELQGIVLRIIYFLFGEFASMSVPAIVSKKSNRIVTMQGTIS